ncbi:hypothetical protein ACFQMA_20395 [Halosimplex aquaticum]|uniref:Uncharacterized protein n=1 Tax=Halosimplex aquaticum TaxID=3026162 RepID=A0ABD5Y4D5_9EURY|nr:hypothetical protein [Halosimplex aquaticum]
MPSLLERLLGDGDTEEGVDLQRREDDAHEALRNRITPETYGIDDCAVTGVAVVNEGPDEEPITVPIARFSLGEDVESPDYDLVWELATEAIRAMVPAFDDVFVRHYDVQFTFDGDELFEAEECRRIAVTPALADRLVTETGFDAAAFKSAMLEADDIDDHIAPVAWGECVDYSRNNDAAVVTGAAAAAAGASAAGASCAGAGAAGGAGGC